MVGRIPVGLLLIPTAVSLSGCLALSFGGKTVEAPPCQCTDDGRLSALESRVQSLEQRLGPTLMSPGEPVEPRTSAR